MSGSPPRKRQQHELLIDDNEEGINEDEEDGGDDKIINDNEMNEDEDKNNHESENSRNKNNDEDINLDDDDDADVVIAVHIDDFDVASNNDIPWDDLNDNRECMNDGNECVDYDNDDDDYHIQRALIWNKPMNTILELIELFPMEIKNTNKLGDYPLHTACFFGCNDIIMKLIEIFPEAAQRPNPQGLYPLHLLIMKNMKNTLEDVEDIVFKLIEIAPAAVMASPIHGTALHFACNKVLSETIITKLIVINPFATQVQDENFKYPFHYAFDNNLPITVIKLLLDSHPLGMQQINERNNETPFHVACEANNNIDLVRYLMQRSDLLINKRGKNGWTPLHYACHFQCYPIVELLLQHPDIDVNTTDILNETPLHKTLSSVFSFDSIICVNIIQTLLEHSFILIDHKNNDNKTPFDLIKDRVNRLSDNKLPCLQNDEVLCFTNIIHLFEEFPIKKRWETYCYHAKNLNIVTTRGQRK